MWARIGNLRGPAGADGSDGTPGESIRGDAGAPGKDGTDGKDAPIPSFTATAKALPAESQPTVDVSGDYPNLTITVGVPAGPVGPAGKDGTTVLVLDADADVPEGTPAGTVIVRRAA